jgi:PIN domain nuclease of toxin-antitoxin system
VRALLDTHALIWWLVDSAGLSRAAHDVLVEPANTVYVSAASAWEIATKHRIGKLPLGGRLVGELGSILKREKFSELPISVRHGELAGSLAGEHRDPFDRMIVAQALEERLTLISNERLFDSFGVSRLW